MVQTGQTALKHRSDRSVRPVPILVVNICPLFFGDASMPKNKPLDQNYLRMMINMHRPYFVLRTINSIGHIMLLLQASDETTCLDHHTCFRLPTLLEQPPLVVPWTPSCAFVATSSFGCEISLGDTTSDVNTYCLASCLSHLPCCN